MEAETIMNDNAKARFGAEILQVNNLRIEVKTDAGPGPVLVDNVSFKLRKGEVLGLIGESGAGKSTIGLASMVYTRSGCFITGGEIKFNCQDLRRLDSDRRLVCSRGKIAYMAQS